MHCPVCWLVFLRSLPPPRQRKKRTMGYVLSRTFCTKNHLEFPVYEFVPHCTMRRGRSRTGERSTGTASHVSEGVYPTACHVIEGNKVLSVILNTGGYLLKQEVPHPPEKWLDTTHYGDEKVSICYFSHDSPLSPRTLYSTRILVLMCRLPTYRRRSENAVFQTRRLLR